MHLTLGIATLQKTNVIDINVEKNVALNSITLYCMSVWSKVAIIWAPQSGIDGASTTFASRLGSNLRVGSGAEDFSYIMYEENH